MIDITTFYLKSNKKFNYFYLDWEKSKVYWKKNIPKKAIKIGIVKCKNFLKNKTVTLCCSVNSYTILKNDKKINIKNIRHNYSKKNIPVLKSNLQKSIRRQKVDVSKKTAISLSLIEDNSNNIKQIGLFELIRRLSVIIIEDVMLMPWFGILVWLHSYMSKKYQIGEKVFDWIIEKVCYISSFHHFDNEYIFYRYNQNFDNNKILLNDIKENERNLLLSLLFRINYGGMDGDLIMFKKIIQIWYDRFKNKSNICNFLLKLKYNKIINYQTLEPDEILLESIDFHCTPICINVNKILNLEKKELKKMIWINRSSINHRLPIKLKYTNLNNKYKINLWNKISEIVDNEAKIIRSNFIKN